MLRLKSQKNIYTHGFSLVEILVAIGLLGGALYAAQTFFFSLKKQQVASNYLVTITSIRQNFISILSRSSNWEATIVGNNDPATLGCLQATTPVPAKCDDGASLPFAVYLESSPTPYFDSSTQALNFEGGICSIGSPNCDIKMNFTAKVLCPVGQVSCEASTAEISIAGEFSSIVFPGAQTIPINLARYAINISHGSVSAASGSGYVIQLKCPFVWKNFGGTERTYISPTCTFASSVSSCLNATGGAIPLGSPCCVPNACPAGFTDVGTLSAETGGYGGNCVRTCYK